MGLQCVVCFQSSKAQVDGLHCNHDVWRKKLKEEKASLNKASMLNLWISYDMKVAVLAVIKHIAFPNRRKRLKNI